MQVASSFFKPTLDGAERRRERRYPTRDRVQVETMDSHCVEGTVTDISRSGMRLELPVRVHKGASITVRLSQVSIFAEVVYCRSITEGFSAGLLVREARHTGPEIEHLDNDFPVLFAAGKGLTAVEFIRAWKHLADCADCRNKVAEAEELVRQAYRTPKRMTARMERVE